MIFIYVIYILFKWTWDLEKADSPLSNILIYVVGGSFLKPLRKKCRWVSG